MASHLVAGWAFIIVSLGSRESLELQPAEPQPSEIISFMEISKVKRSIMSIESLCNKEMGHERIIQLCVPANFTRTFTLPYSAPTYGEVTLEQAVGGYTDCDYYVIMGVEDNSWGNVATYTGTDWTPYPTTETAKIWARILTLTRTRTHLTVTLDFRGQEDKFECQVLRIYAYYPGPALDPFAEILVCKQEGITLLPDNYAYVNEVALRRGVGSVQPEKIDVDTFFYLATGVDTTVNTWVQLAQQAAQNTATDCLVCMKARPTVLVVPATYYNDTCETIIMSGIDRGKICEVDHTTYPVLASNTQPPIFRPPDCRQLFMYRTSNRRGKAGLSLGRSSFPVSLCQDSDGKRD
ncbi:uncharacterized protein LOC110170120 [Boleophthalmus pectinirostris]|uniref:uncharacterized protein LOC110170120 n=1 Tax=Boleophthalmus pectinirostris TaxID=150288 RepID=UPI00242A4825|nr:uncharacterized protein LOC110170120 [Boleophthalmus pectinirostris]XP_055005025.1 uncharacterized protein LOC110170120 [Boleophthalmus pectinirostris]